MPGPQKHSLVDRGVSLSSAGTGNVPEYSPKSQAEGLVPMQHCPGVEQLDHKGPDVLGGLTRQLDGVPCWRELQAVGNCWERVPGPRPWGPCPVPGSLWFLPCFPAPGAQRLCSAASFCHDGLPHPRTRVMESANRGSNLRNQEPQINLSSSWSQ